MTQRLRVSFFLVALAGAWPTMMTAVSWAIATPLQRALADSICGAQSGPLGHCPPCWTISALLAATGLLVLASIPARRAAAHAGR